MFWRDHCPPHFHAKYADDEVTIEIKTGIVNGTISNRALKLIQEWREVHIDDLLQEWELAEQRKALYTIKGLE